MELEQQEPNAEETILRSLSLPELEEATAKLVEMEAYIKTSKEALKRELARRFKDQVIEEFAAQDKTSGKVTCILGGGYVVEGEIAKTVEWNKETLTKIAGELPPELRAKVFEVDIKVPEKTYKTAHQIPVGDGKLTLKDMLDEARTIITKEPAFKLKKAD